MDTIVITPSSQKSIPFLKELLNKLSDVKHVEVVSSDADKKAKIYNDINSGLKEVKDVMEGKAQVKSFEQYLNEL
jgi:hypothetical protein